MSLYKINLLEKQHYRSHFSCSIEELDNYLKHQASQDRQRDIATVYALTEEGSNDVLGYYTLSSTIIPLDDLPENEAKRLPRYPNIPAILIGRLAVDKRCQSKGYGEILLINALKKSLDLSSKIGSMAVVVYAINDKAKSFYKHFGFIPFQSLHDRLFITMKTIRKLPS